jgi:Outer membrane protein beta-barrel domain
MFKQIVFAILVARLAAPAILHAQVNESASDFGVGSLTIGAEYSRISPDYWGRNLTVNGVSGFAEYNLQGIHFGGGLAGEYRMLTESANNHRRETSILFGPRMVYRIQRFYPYMKFSAGIGQFTQDAPANQAGNHFVVAPAGGLDYRLNRHLFVRAFDYEYQFWAFGANGLTPHILSFGMSYHLR